MNSHFKRRKFLRVPQVDVSTVLTEKLTNCNILENDGLVKHAATVVVADVVHSVHLCSSLKQLQGYIGLVGHQG